MGQYTSITTFRDSFGARDFVYISYFDETNDRLKIAGSTNSGGSWSIAGSAFVGRPGQYSSIACDSKLILRPERVFLSYYAYTDGDLRFLKSLDEGKTW